MDIYLHSYTFRNEPFAAACEAAGELGFDGVELSRVHFDDTNLSEDIVYCVTDTQSHDTNIRCVDFAADFSNPDDSAAEETYTRLVDMLELIPSFDISLLNGYVGTLVQNPDEYSANGSALADDGHFERTAARLNRIAETAAARGAMLNLELHMNTIHDTIDAAKRLLDAVDSPHIRVTPDPGNLYATHTVDADPARLDALNGHIGYFHFKSCRKSGNSYDFSVGLREGDIDIPAYVQKLKQLGYSGPVCLEYVGDRDPVPILEADIQYLRELFG